MLGAPGALTVPVTVTFRVVAPVLALGMLALMVPTAAVAGMRGWIVALAAPPGCVRVWVGAKGRGAPIWENPDTRGPAQGALCGRVSCV